MTETITCIDAPPHALRVDSFEPSVVCPGDTVTIHASGFLAPAGVRYAKVHFTVDGGTTSIEAQVASRTEVGASTPGVQAVFEVDVPDLVRTEELWQMTLEGLGDPPQISAPVFLSRGAVCPDSSADLVGVWTLLYDRDPSDLACDGPGASREWRFWRDGSWTDGYTDIEDLTVVPSRSVHITDGTWTSTWHAATSTFLVTSSACDNVFGDVKEFTGVYDPALRRLFGSYTAGRSSESPGTEELCGASFARSRGGYLIATCDPDREPMVRSRCWHTETTPTCYDPSTVSCY